MHVASTSSLSILYDLIIAEIYSVVNYNPKKSQIKFVKFFTLFMKRNDSHGIKYRRVFIEGGLR